MSSKKTAVHVKPLTKGDSLDEHPEVKGKLALFWGGWASNWAPAKFTVDGQSYNCTEQWFMAEKARFFGDEATRVKILKARTPMAQKELGREVKGYKDGVWSKERYGIMVKGVVAKFEQDERHRSRICAVPADVRFVEASPHDDIWGIGMGVDDPSALIPSRWKGKNLLGKALDVAHAKVCMRNRSEKK